MVLPEKLVKVGLTLGSLLASAEAVPDDAWAANVLKLRDLNGLVGASTTDLVRFSGTLKVARGIVEEHRRAEVVEVPTDSLVSILERIQALENEVMALMNGKGVSTDGKAIGSSTGTGSASGGSASSSPSGASSAAAPASDAGSSSSTPSDGSSSSPPEGSSSSSSEGSQSGSSPSSGSSAGTSPAVKASDGGSSAGTGSDSGEDDCAPEQLLYRLGGGSVQRRSTTVSEHPLFRRSTNCTLDSVAGGRKGKALPSGGVAVFKESSASGTADSSTGTDAPAAGADGGSQDTTATSGSTGGSNSASADNSLVNLGGHTFGVSGVASAAPDATAAPGSNDGSSSPSSSDVEPTVTVTLTSTIYTTTTIYPHPGTTKALPDAKYLNGTALFPNSTTATETSSSVVGATLERANIDAAVTSRSETSMPVDAASLSSGLTSGAAAPTASPPQTETPAMARSSLGSEAGGATSVTSETAVASPSSIQPLNATTAKSEAMTSVTLPSTPQPVRNQTTTITDAEAEAETSATLLPNTSQSVQNQTTTRALPTGGASAPVGISSGLASAQSSATANERLAEDVVVVTSTTTLTTSVTIFLGPGPSATRGSPSNGTNAEAETTSRPALVGGTDGADRRRGFKTVVVRDGNPIADME